MASSLQVIQHLKSEFSAVEIDESALTFLVNLPSDKNQLVFAFVGESLLSLKSPIASMENVKPSRILELVEFKFLGVQKFAEQYAIAACVPIENILTEEIEQMCVLVAQQADSVQAVLTASDPY